MHTRRARIGTSRHPLLAQASPAADSNVTTVAPTTPYQPTATPSPSSSRQSTLTEFFSEKQVGFDDVHRAIIEAQVEQSIREAEAEPPQQASPLSIPITLLQLQTAQRRLNTASCHGKDKIPNAALKTILLEWQVLLLALLNVILHLA